MNKYTTAALLASLVFAGSVSAQTTMSATPAAKQAAKVTQDCKDRVTTQKGEKRQDAVPSADTDAKCADAPMKAAATKHHMKKKGSHADMAASATN